MLPPLCDGKRQFDFASLLDDDDDDPQILIE